MGLVAHGVDDWRGVYKKLKELGWTGGFGEYSNLQAKLRCRGWLEIRTSKEVSIVEIKGQRFECKYSQFVITDDYINNQSIAVEDKRLRKLADLTVIPIAIPLCMLAFILVSYDYMWWAAGSINLAVLFALVGVRLENKDNNHIAVWRRYKQEFLLHPVEKSNETNVGIV